MRQCYRRNTCDSKLRRQSSSNSSTTYNSRPLNIRPRKLPSRPHSCRKRRHLGKPALFIPYRNYADLPVSRFRSSNNPFATNNPFGQPTTPSPVPTPQLSPFTFPSSARSDTSTPALVHGRPASSASISSRTSSLPPRTPISARAPDALSAVLASAGPGGVDSFGNVGSLRYGSSAFGRAAQRAAAP